MTDSSTRAPARKQRQGSQPQRRTRQRLLGSAPSREPTTDMCISPYLCPPISELRARTQERILSTRTLYHGMRESFNVFRSSLCISVKTAWPCLNSRIPYWSATVWRNRPMKRCRFVPPATTPTLPRPRSATAAGNGFPLTMKQRMSACIANAASVIGQDGDPP